MILWKHKLKTDQRWNHYKTELKFLKTWVSIARTDKVAVIRKSIKDDTA